MPLLDDFRDSVKRDEPLASHTYFRLGGPAQYFVRPRSIDELAALIRRCREENLPTHVLGGGCNLLVRDEGVQGVVIKLDQPAFCDTQIDGRRVTAGAGVLLSSAITQTTKRNLAGLELLVGIPGSIGGSIRMNAGGRAGDVAQFVRQVTVMDHAGAIRSLGRDEIEFDYRESKIEEPLILNGVFELDEDSPDAIVRRMRKIWITKKSTQPLGFQSAGCIFKNTRGLAAGMLIDQAGLKGTSVGGAEVSDRHANFIVAKEGCTARDVLRLIDLVRARVEKRFSIELELEIQVW